MSSHWKISYAWITLVIILITEINNLNGSLIRTTQHGYLWQHCLNLNLNPVTLIISSYQGYRARIVDVREEILRKRRAGKLPEGTTTVLKAWWQAHSKWPYPTVFDVFIFLFFAIRTSVQSDHDELCICVLKFLLDWETRLWHCNRFVMSFIVKYVFHRCRLYTARSVPFL